MIKSELAIDLMNRITDKYHEYEEDDHYDTAVDEVYEIVEEWRNQIGVTNWP